MRNSIHQEVRGDYELEIYSDDTNPLDLIDITMFDSDESLNDYLDKFKNGDLALYGIVIRSLCRCCKQPAESIESLWGIEAESVERAIDYYFTSGYASESVEKTFCENFPS